MSDAQYLGDGVHAAFDGFHVVLTTTHFDGRITNTIPCEPKVIDALLAFLVTVRPAP